MNPTPIIELIGLSVFKAATILHNVSWKVMPGENWVILGANGAGKSTLLHAITAYDSFSGGTIKIAGNTCRDYLRKGWRKHENRLITPEELQKLGNAPQEDRDLIMDVMKLPGKYREAVLLVFWHGMTIREAAKCMCTSESTVFRRLEKAKQMIA